MWTLWRPCPGYWQTDDGHTAAHWQSCGLSLARLRTVCCPQLVTVGSPYLCLRCLSAAFACQTTEGQGRRGGGSSLEQCNKATASQLFKPKLIIKFSPKKLVRFVVPNICTLATPRKLLNIGTRLFVCVHTYVRTYIHTYIHAYIHTYIHT